MRPHSVRLATLLALVITALAPLPAGAAEKFTVLLDWFVNPDHATLVVGKEKGYFAEVGLDVELVAPANPNDPPKLVAAGRAEVAVSYQPQLYLQVAAGLPLTRIATIVATPLNSLVVLADGPIRSIADLKGKKIGFSISGLEDALLGAMLGRHGLTLKDVTLINVNFSLSPSLISGQVDAVIGAYRNFELNQMDIVGRPGRAFYVEEEGVPPYDELIVVANRDRAGGAAMRRFVDVLERAVQFLINHPDEAWKLFVGRYPKLDDELNKRAWRDTLPRFALRPGSLDTVRYERFAEFVIKQGLIKELPTLSTYAVELR